MEAKYVGKGWLKEFDGGGHVISISVKRKDILDLPEDEYGNIRLSVGSMRKPDEKSKATHSVKVDAYWYEKHGDVPLI